MTSNRSNIISTMSTRQKLTAGIFILVLIFLAYQVYALLRGNPAPSSPPSIASSTTNNVDTPNNGLATPPQQIMSPAPATLTKPTVALTEREAMLMKLQQETEAKYLSALNELQMLKVERDIAETNKAIMSAKLDTVTSQKNIIDLLKPPAPVVNTGTYAQGLVNPVSTTSKTTTTVVTPPVVVAPAPTPSLNYSVISVSQLQYRWSAVIGYQGNLYSVSIGDFLPPDQSKVVSIDKSGVVVEKSGERRKLSLVPII